MAQTLSLSDQPIAGAAAVNTALLAKVIYRSRAVHPLSGSDLHHLTLAAQARNRAESITGLVLYDDDRFFQWLEGPKDGLERVMQSIRKDPRHTDIDVLAHEPADGRRFSGWDLKLATSNERSAAWPRDAIAAPPAMIDDLRQHPSRAPALLERLVPARRRAFADLGSDDPVGTLHRHTAAVLRKVMLETVLPELATRHGLMQPGLKTMARRAPPVSSRVAELADLLIAPDQDAAFQLIEELGAHVADELPFYATLFEPAARALGDLWSEDSCSEFEVTLGLSRIQMAVRFLSAGASRRMVTAAASPTVLIAPEPGEIHRLGATMDSEVLRRAGWAPQCEYPSNDVALQHLLAATWFDVLDLSLSAAFRREHWLPRLALTIEGARRASRNSALVIVVGGRVFGEVAAAGTRVGADVASTTALDLEGAILRCLGDVGPP